MYRSVRALLLCASILALFASSSVGDEKKTPPKGLRVFSCGHSFHVFMPSILADMAKGAGITDHKKAGLSSIGGSRVIQHWNVKDDKFGSKAALAKGEVDVLTLSPIYPPDDGIDKFVELALKHNPKVRITIQENWLPFDLYETTFKVRPKTVDHDKPTLEELTKLHQPYFDSLDKVVRDLNKQHKSDSVFVVPVGQAVVALRGKILDGKAPGLKKQSELFTDAIGHATPPLQALVSYCHYAVVYRTSPVGLPMPAVLRNDKKGKWDEKLNKVLQETAWEAVTSHPLSGVKAEKK